jgi:hypothetical protein
MLLEKWIDPRRAAIGGHHRKGQGENCQTSPELHEQFDTGRRPFPI